MKTCKGCKHGDFSAELINNDTSNTNEPITTQTFMNHMYTDLMCNKGHKRKYGMNKCNDYRKEVS